MNIIFFRRPRPRQFNYVPRYYDPVKEEVEQRKKELGLLSEGDIKERLRADIRRKWKVERSPRSGRIFLIRIFFYVIISILAIYYIFFTDLINNLVSFFLQ